MFQGFTILIIEFLILILIVNDKVGVRVKAFTLNIVLEINPPLFDTLHSQIIINPTLV
jgi:hypothetical protein